MENTYILTSDGELYHWGVKGMKWGVRRYQNKDGTLTDVGKKRLAKQVIREDKRGYPHRIRDLTNETFAGYKDSSASYQKAKASKDNVDKIKRSISDQVNINTIKSTGIDIRQVSKEMSEFVNKTLRGEFTTSEELRRYTDNVAKRNTYMIAAGKEAVRLYSSDKTFREAVRKHDENYKNAFKEGSKYIKDYLGKYGDMALTSKNAVTVDMETGSVRQTTVAERMSADLVSDIRDNSIRR